MADIISITIKHNRRIQKSIDTLMSIGWIEPSEEDSESQRLTPEGVDAVFKVIELFYESGLKDEPGRNMMNRMDGLIDLTEIILKDFEHLLTYLVYVHPQLEEVGINSMKDLDLALAQINGFIE